MFFYVLQSTIDNVWCRNIQDDDDGIAEPGVCIMVTLINCVEQDTDEGRGWGVDVRSNNCLQTNSSSVQVESL